jgi:glycosyltransferase involved in cell wall biosynthesis
MKIAVDCRMYNSSGIGTYLQGILPFLIQEKKHVFLLIGDHKVLEKYLCESVAIQDCHIPFFSFAEFFNFPVKDINKCDVFLTPNYNIPSFIKIPIYSYIHDVVFLDLKELTSKFGFFVRIFFLKRALILSTTVFTVSNFSKGRIEAHFDTKLNIIVAYGSIKQNLISFNSSLESKFEEEYILFVGNIKKHKGLKTLLEGWNYACSNGFDKKLYIIGEKEGFKTNDKLFVLNTDNPNIVFLGKISDDELFRYMKEAHLLVQPSEYEGFGLPPLESLFLGTNCLMSDIPVFDEIYADFESCFFFKTGDYISLGDKLLTVKPVRVDQKGRILKKFSFQLTASLIIGELTKIKN